MTMTAYFFKCQFYNSLIPLSAVLEGKGFPATGEEPSDAQSLQEQSELAKRWIQDLVCVREADFRRFLVAYSVEQRDNAAAHDHLLPTPASPGGLPECAFTELCVPLLAYLAGLLRCQ